MKFFALIVLTGLIVYGQESKEHRNADQSQASTVQPSMARTIITVHQDASNGQEHSHTQQSESYLHHLLSPEVLAQVALVFVAIWGIGVAVRTLKAIERQAVQMEKQTPILGRSVAVAEEDAKITRENFEMIIEKERPHLKFEPLDYIPDKNDVGEIRIVNNGETEARIVKVGFRLEITKRLVLTPDYGQCQPWRPFNIPGNGSEVCPAEPEPPFDDPSQIERLKNARLYIHFYGFADYTGIWKDKGPWTTTFHFRWMGRWRRTARPMVGTPETYGWYWPKWMPQKAEHNRQT